ncbi:MAG: hypothetical protein R6V44_00250 [Paracoccaceae bacterium]
MKGLFLRVQKDGSPVTRKSDGYMLGDDVFRAVRACSARLDLPIVALVDSRDA